MVYPIHTVLFKGEEEVRREFERLDKDRSGNITKGKANFKM